MFKKHTKDTIRLFLTGFSMGTADIVPGVSGGTIAFIAGIYEELIYSIKSLSGKVLFLALKGKPHQAIKATPFRFLVPLGLGILIAFATLSKLISTLLATQPVYMWSFFLGLVIASIYVVRKRVVTWDPTDILAFVLSAIGAYFLVGLVPSQTPNTLPFIFLSGFIAIIAMILPGISGSFLLLIMGKYDQILHAVVEKDILTIGVFGIGAVIGLAIFSRVLTWLFQRHHDLVIAILTGFMLGSLRKVWPWKEVVEYRINSKGLEVPLYEVNVLPQKIDSSFMFAIFLIIAGAAIIIYLGRLHLIKETTQDIESPRFKKQHKQSVESQKH